MTAPREPLTSMEHLALEMHDAAIELACLVRDGDLDETGSYLESLRLDDRQRAWALAAMLASLVDIDRPVSELLSWMTSTDPAEFRSQGRPRAECGTYAAYLRHLKENRERKALGLHPLPIHDKCYLVGIEYMQRYREEHAA